MTHRIHLFLGTVLIGAASHAQYTPPDPSGLEGIIVETYYVADTNDAADTDGSDGGLHVGARTYRVFADLKQGYKLLTAGGFTDHPITFNTSTRFFNNLDRGEAWGDHIGHTHLDENTVALDSWLSMGAASDLHWGIPKADDPDGAQSGIENNDGGSVGTPLLVNSAPEVGIPLTTADGMWSNGSVPGTSFVGVPPDCFDVGDSTHYSSDNFAWAVLGGVAAPDSANRILLGQFTTDGVFSFCLNIWIKIPDSLVCNDPNCHTILEFYGNLLASDTAGTGYAGDNKFTLPGLCFDSSQQPSDCAGIPGGSALPGTGCDDGNADTQNDVYSTDCVCVGEDCLGVLGGNALPGQPCDDNDPGTTNDTWLTGCLCQGSVGMVEQQQGRVHVFPNPAHDLLRVDLEGMNGGPVSIAITSVTGEQVLLSDFGTRRGTSHERVDISSLARGVYIVSVIAGERTFKERIITH